MVSKIQIESWILMHACKHKHRGVVKSLIGHYHSKLDELDVPDIYISAAMIHDIVSSDYILQYPAAIHHLNFIQSQVPDAVPFKLHSKLTMGLKMKFVMQLLEKNHSDTFVVLNRYFPRGGSQYERVSQRELARLHSAQMNFRKFFLPLLAHNNQRKAYFQDEYHDEYGDEYQEALHQLVDIFMDSLQSHLPPTTIDKILSDGPDHYQPLLEDSPCLPLEMLLDTLHGKETITEKDLMDLLTMISPNHTQDRVKVDKVQLLNVDDSNQSSSDNRTNSKSLFSSESDWCHHSNDVDNIEENMDSSEITKRTCVKSTIQRKSENSEKSEIQGSKSDVDIFDDFNEHRHLFHHGTQVDDQREKGDNLEKQSPIKSSGESVSLLKTGNPKTKTTCRPRRGAHTASVHCHVRSEAQMHDLITEPRLVENVSQFQPLAVPKVRNVLKNVHRYFKTEQRSRAALYLDNPIKRLSKATGFNVKDLRSSLELSSENEISIEDCVSDEAKGDKRVDPDVEDAACIVIGDTETNDLSLSINNTADINYCSEVDLTRSDTGQSFCQDRDTDQELAGVDTTRHEGHLSEIPEQVNSVSSSNSHSYLMVEDDIGSENFTKIVDQRQQTFHSQPESPLQSIQMIDDRCNDNNDNAIVDDEGNDVLTPWAPEHSDIPEEGWIGDKSESDIDQISDAEFFVPPSRMEDMEFWDIFSDEDQDSQDRVPSILVHRKPANLKLCVVKLFKDKSLDSILPEKSGVLYS